MLKQIWNRETLLTKAFDILDFRLHPSLAEYFAKKQVRLQNLLSKL